MGRPLRLKAPGLTYHITSRTHGKQLFLQKHDDKRTLCKIMKRVFTKYGIILYGFNAMNNHIHILIKIENDADLSQVMGEFKSLYAKYFNKKYKVTGAFWGERFHSTIVQDDRHALACLSYIDRNPVTAGLVRHPAKWPFSSFSHYALGCNHPIFTIQSHPAYLALADIDQKRRTYYIELVLKPDDGDNLAPGDLSRLLFYGSADFIQDVKRILN